MNELLESIEKIETINQLIEELQTSLKLLERGKAVDALESVKTTETEIQELISDFNQLKQKGGNSVNIENNLSQALDQLNWVEENADLLGK